MRCWGRDSEIHGLRNIVKEDNFIFNKICTSEQSGGLDRDYINVPIVDFDPYYVWHRLNRPKRNYFNGLILRTVTSRWRCISRQ